MIRTLACAWAALIVLATPVAAQSGCASAIAGFRAVIDSDAKTGHLNRSVYDRIVPQVEQITQLCRTGRDSEALRALAGLKSRYGYH